MADELNERMRRLPAVDRVVAALQDVSPRAAAAAARRAVEAARARVAAGEDAPSVESIVEDAAAFVARARLQGLVPVVNATGVLVHTNLGRVPLGREQLEAVTSIAGGYSNLEYDVVEGRRGSRYDHARRAVAELTGAEDALVVNNCAAAVLLVLATLCRGRDVLISRGELIEIGGEFRIPEIMSASGARLVEVGTTNRTHLGDYERAISPETAAILKVHPSNYRVVGFTASVPARDLARLARGRGIPFVHDLGSGLVAARELAWAGDAGWGPEPVAGASVAEGADLVTFSGDKLLGGPQAGIVAGRGDLVARLAKSPLLRALRVDKMTLAALEATLALHLDGRAGSIPLWAFATAGLDDMERRATALADLVRAGVEDAGGAAKVEPLGVRSVLGGGSVPGAELRSWGVAVSHPERGPQDVAERLRLRPVPVVARVDDDLVLLDLRTVPPRQDDEVAAALLEALA
ncbi:MAG TPA: L-seryl-tRNA(Sec) selenium transferase [Actinomycetota bacterium]|nr:L-seryl-tRNA(Sec) selenium transferase [Actinomycetota bacterium]